VERSPHPAIFWWPSHILIWYAVLAAGIGAILWARPSGISVKMAWLTAGLAVAAGFEYGISSLGDAEETFRHLFLFHALTDVTVCLGCAFVGQAFLPVQSPSSIDDPKATATPARRAAKHT
jgi:hypothetical protein